MALLFMDGFDHYTSDAHILDKGWAYGTVSYVNISSVYARFGGNGVRLENSGTGTLLKDIGVNKSTIYFGVAFKKSELGMPAGLGSDHGILCVLDEISVYQVELYISSTYQISAYRGDDVLLGSSAVNVIPDQKWCYIETKITISDTVGEVTVRVNETQVLNLTSQDTKNGSDYIRKVRFGAVNFDLNTQVDDIYIDDAQFHGDCRIRAFVPDSISSTNNDFTASAGNKDECVDEMPPNEDTDYIVSDTLNHKQTFGITTGVLSTVKAIQVNNFCRLDQAGVRKITPLIRSNSANYSGTETDEVAADWHFESEVWELDPDDSAVWTQTKLEAAEFGLEITT